jgi:hypothetical protein
MMRAYRPAFAYANGDIRRESEPDRKGPVVRRRGIAILDLAAIGIGGSLGTCAALVLLVRAGLSDGNSADVMTAAAAGLIAGGIADVQASGLWARSVAATAGAFAGTGTALLLTASFAAAVHSPLLGGQASGALGVALGAVITMAVSLNLSRAKPQILDVALQAGIVNGVAVCLAIGGAVGGLLAVEYYRLVSPGAAPANAETIGIATGSGIGAFVGLIIGVAAGMVAVLFTVLFSPSRSLPVVGSRNVSIGAALVAIGCALAATTAALIAWFLTVFAVSAVARVFAAPPLASAIADFVALLVAAIAGLATAVFAVSTAVDLYMSAGIWNRLWGNEDQTADLAFEETLPMAAMLVEAILASNDFEDGHANGTLWLLGTLVGLLVGAVLALGLSVGRSQATMVALAVPLIAACTAVGLVAGIRLQHKQAPNFDNTRSPVLVAVWEAFYRSIHVGLGGLLAGVIGLGVGVVPLALNHTAGGKWLEVEDIAGAGTAIIVGLALARPLKAGIEVFGHWLRNSSWERSMTRRPPPRPILVPEKNLRDVWGLVLACRYEDAIAIARTIELKRLSQTQKRDLATATWWSVQGRPDNAADRQAGCEIVVAIHGLLLSQTLAGANLPSGSHYPDDEAAWLARAAAAFQGIVAMTAKAVTGPAWEFLRLLGWDNGTGRADFSTYDKVGSQSLQRAETDLARVPVGESKSWTAKSKVAAADRTLLLSITASDPVANGKWAYVLVVTSPGAVCSVSVRWHSGHLSRSKALRSSCIAGPDGTARWDWHIRNGTTRGEAQARVKATITGASWEVAARFLVT